MTDHQKSRIADMRAKGYGYKRMAAILGISVNTVKSFCHRENICYVKEETQQQDGCPYCGRPVASVNRAKPKRFCGERCRYAWWNAHRNEKNRKAPTNVVCNNCGITFKCYDGASRKYCSHPCYIAARYGKVSV